MENWQVKIIDVGYSYLRNVFLFRRTHSGKIELLKGNEIITADENSVQEPSLRLSPESLQAFADALADIGIKPQKGFIEGKLEATENHLKDMRTLLKLK